MKASNDLKFYVSVLRSNGCQCGKPKKPRMALCYTCYKELPDHMQKDLYKQLGYGFEEAFDKAVQWLN